jgi:putative spermidine/putrescine transport system substrate-binding protein
MQITRRQILGTALASGLAAPTIWRRAWASTTSITVRDPGGSYLDAYREAFYAPFEAKTGIKVIPAAASHEPTAQIKAMVEAKSYTWDVALLSLAAHNQLVNENLLDPLDIDGSAIQDLPTGYRRPHFAGVDVYSTVLAYRTDTVKTPPGSWADFWNTAKFPGRRCLRGFPFDTVEEALMADGVPAAGVYPCDLDRAFKSLDRIRSSIDVWWKESTQASQLLQTGEAEIVSIYNGAAQRIVDAGQPVKIVWNQNISGVEGWCILKGTPNAQAARDFIAFTMQSEQQAIMAKSLTYGPTNPRAYDHINSKRAALLSTYPEYRNSALLIDNDYWAAKKDGAIDRFDAWLRG